MYPRCCFGGGPGPRSGGKGQNSMSTCPNCGAQVADGWKFCGTCGASAPTEMAPATVGVGAPAAPYTEPTTYTDPAATTYAEPAAPAYTEPAPAYTEPAPAYSEPAPA